MHDRQGFEAWIAGSAFVDGNGLPTVWCHGTDAERFNIFAFAEEGSIGFHFGSKATAERRLDDIQADDDARIIEVHCRAKRPLRLRDHFTWTLRSIVGELEDLGILVGDEGDEIIDAGDDALLFASIERAGYDCIVYENETERNGDSLLIWRQELIKAVGSSVFDMEDPRIDPSADTDEEDWALHRSWKAGLERAVEALVARPRTMEMAF